MKRLVSLFLVVLLAAGYMVTAAAAGDHMYIIPDSDKRKLTERNCGSGTMNPWGIS